MQIIARAKRESNRKFAGTTLIRRRLAGRDNNLRHFTIHEIRPRDVLDARRYDASFMHDHVLKQESHARFGGDGNFGTRGECRVAARESFVQIDEERIEALFNFVAMEGSVLMRSETHPWLYR